MTVIVKSINTFDTIQLNNVSNIAFAGSTYTITHGDEVSTYSSANYRVFII